MSADELDAATVAAAAAGLLCCLAFFYRGKRHALGLPVRGQHTATNAKTARKFKRHLMYDVK